MPSHGGHPQILSHLSFSLSLCALVPHCLAGRWYGGGARVGRWDLQLEVRIDGFNRALLLTLCCDVILLDGNQKSQTPNHRLDGAKTPVNNGISTTNLNWWVYRISSSNSITGNLRGRLVPRTTPPMPRHAPGELRPLKGRDGGLHVINGVTWGPYKWPKING